MPKMKTHKGAAKRTRITGTGRIARRKAGGQHLFKHKTKSRQIRLKGNELVHDTDEKQTRRLLGI